MLFTLQQGFSDIDVLLYDTRKNLLINKIKIITVNIKEQVEIILLSIKKFNKKHAIEHPFYSKIYLQIIIKLITKISTWIFMIYFHSFLN